MPLGIKTTSIMTLGASAEYSYAVSFLLSVSIKPIFMSVSIKLILTSVIILNVVMLSVVAAFLMFTLAGERTQYILVYLLSLYRWATEALYIIYILAW